MKSNRRIQSALESLLFAFGDPLSVRDCARLFDLGMEEMRACFLDLMGDYEARGSGLRIRRMDDSFQMATAMENDDYIRRLVAPGKEKRLSRAALEVLAIIAYRQPVTKGEVDAIRGIRSDRVLETLMSRDLVEEQGRSSTIGRPTLYGTTREFLARFGFESLEDLPEIRDTDTLVFGEEEEEGPASQLSFSSMAASEGEEA